MKRLSALLIAALLPACAYAPQVAQWSPVESAFADACRLSQYDCTGVLAPEIRTTDFGETFGVYGVYLGGTLVHVAADLDFRSDPFAYAILVHEVVHYLQVAVGGMLPSTSLLEVCVKEEEAYSVSNAVLVELHFGDKARAFPYDQRCAVVAE